MLLEILTIIFVLFGVFFLAVSALLSIRLKKSIPETFRTQWAILSFLMFIFIIGYCLFLMLQIKDFPFPLEFLTGNIFLFGAFFVFLVVRLSEATISNLVSKERELDNANKSLQKAHDELEERVKLRTLELEQIFQTAADGMRLLDMEGIIIRANSAFSALCGLPVEQIIGRKCSDVFFGEKCHGPDCPMQLIRKGADGVEYEVEKIKSDGSKVYCIVNATPFLSPDGEMIGIVEDFKDISARKIAEEKNERLIDELQTALDEIKTLSGIIPICSYCKQIRDDKGYWNRVENYVADHSEAKFSHSICPDCMATHHPEVLLGKNK